MCITDWLPSLDRYFDIDSGDLPVNSFGARLFGFILFVFLVSAVVVQPATAQQDQAYAYTPSADSSREYLCHLPQGDL